MAALNVAAGAAFWLCAAALLVLAVLSWFAARLLNRSLSIPMPYWMRSILLLPRGPCSPQHLERLLEPLSGERVLEIGPGIGIHALPVASRLLPEGVLDAFDAQQEMLDELGRRAEKAATTNIVMVRGDAQVLPYADSTFDAAYLIGTLGEIHDRVEALREARRVLKASGRLVVGEVIIDPDYVQMSVLRAEAEAAGFVLVRSTGPRFCYLSLFRPRAFLPDASASRRA
jgi:SAM-dependent methyltransferase